MMFFRASMPSSGRSLIAVLLMRSAPGALFFDRFFYSLVEFFGGCFKDFFYVWRCRVSCFLLFLRVIVLGVSLICLD